jgi:hypothetical protein
MPKKATATPLPLRGARLCRAKNGKTSKLASLKHDAFLSIFCPTQTAAPNADENQHTIKRCKWFDLKKKLVQING